MGEMLLSATQHRVSYRIVWGRGEGGGGGGGEPGPLKNHVVKFKNPIKLVKSTISTKLQLT